MVWEINVGIDVEKLVQKNVLKLKVNAENSDFHVW